MNDQLKNAIELITHLDRETEMEARSMYVVLQKAYGLSLKQAEELFNEALEFVPDQF